jgi:hypothetical protein
VYPSTIGHCSCVLPVLSSEPIRWDDEAATVEAKIAAIDTVTDATVKFQEWGGTACTEYGHAFTVEFTQDFGDLPLMSADWSKLTHDAIHPGFSPYLYVFELRQGTREDDVCANRGICDPMSGICLCVASDSPDFDTSNGGQPARLGDQRHNRGDCGYPTKGRLQCSQCRQCSRSIHCLTCSDSLTPLSALESKPEVIVGCPGEIACSAHGVCAGEPTYRCTCSVGYTGADCSEFQCASSPSWFDTPIADQVAHQPAECANMGHCDRTKGDCLCAMGFEGGSCNRMMCAGNGFCYGHGNCLPMHRLAEELIGTNDGTIHTDVGELTPQTYGLTPNNPATWDYDMVHMCVCDDTYTGHHCDFRSW